MTTYRVFDSRMAFVGTVNAKDEVQAMQLAKSELHVVAPGVQRLLTREEERQKSYDDQDRIWHTFNRHQRY